MLCLRKGLAALSNMKPISDHQDHEKAQAVLQLMNELEKGRKSGEEEGWLTAEAVKKHLGIASE